MTAPFVSLFSAVDVSCALLPSIDATISFSTFVTGVACAFASVVTKSVFASTFFSNVGIFVSSDVGFTERDAVVGLLARDTGGRV